MASGISATAAQNVEWVTTAITVVVFITRLVLQRYQPTLFGLSSFLVLASIIVIGTRTGVTYYMLLYGTANDALLTPDRNYDTPQLEKIKIGSILALVARMLITTFYWLQSIILLLFYARLVSHFPAIKTIITLCWFTVAASYVAVILSTCLECRPFKLYWQVEPPPGHCVRAYIQITLQCVTNIVIDLLLLAISSPLLRIKTRDWRGQIKIGVLFVLGISCIICTCVRTVEIYAGESSEPTRNTWASIQVLVSAIVANMPTIYGSWQLRLRKRAGSIGNPPQGTRAADEEILISGCTFSPSGGSVNVTEMDNLGVDGSMMMTQAQEKTLLQHVEAVAPPKTKA